MVGCIVKRLLFCLGAMACSLERGCSAEGLLNMWTLFSDAPDLACSRYVWNNLGWCCRKETFQELVFLLVLVASICSKLQLQALSTKLSTSSVLFFCIRKEEVQPLLVNCPYFKSYYLK